MTIVEAKTTHKNTYPKLAVQWSNYPDIDLDCASFKVCACLEVKKGK